MCLLFVTLTSQGQNDKILANIRSDFQLIDSEEDIDKILAYDLKNVEETELHVIKAYQAVATCMMAKYVFSPLSKLKYFNTGKKNLEELILKGKEVENIYLRLLLQLNVPRSLNYNKNIEEDVSFIQASLGASTIDMTYKDTMIKNLVSVAKKDQLKDILLQMM